MSCGCKTSGDSTHNCGTKSTNGCENVDTCGSSYKLSVFDWLSDIGNPISEKSNLVEVRFKNDRKCFFRNGNHIPLHIGSVVTVESSPGHDVGVVSLTGELVKIQVKKKNIQPDQICNIFRLASQKDIETWQEYRKKEEDVKRESRKIAEHLRLNMKISDVEFQGDGSKLTFYYTSESRVDFRQLIKELALSFRTRIEMKQIGFRQEAAKIGGIGSCGRELCCSTWLTDFRSVNTNAARYQQLSINPQKLAGQCGKLKCCLNYELDSYLDTLKDFPSSSTNLQTDKGKAFCIKIDVFKRKMWFAYVESSHTWYDLSIEAVHEIISINKKGKNATALEDYLEKDLDPKTVDLIGEDSVDRFEKKQKTKKNNRNKFSKINPKTNDLTTQNTDTKVEANTQKKKRYPKKYPPKNKSND